MRRLTRLVVGVAAASAVAAVVLVVVLATRSSAPAVTPVPHAATAAAEARNLAAWLRRYSR